MKTKAASNGGPAANDTHEYRSNPEVDSKIDSYIKENPKYWEFLQAAPRERLQRMLVLKEVQTLDRQHRIRDGVLNEIKTNPELKQAYDTILRNVPEDMRETVMGQVVDQTRRTVARSHRTGSVQP